MFRAIMLTGKARDVFATIKKMAEKYPDRTIGEITIEYSQAQRR